LGGGVRGSTDRYEGWGREGDHYLTCARGCGWKEGGSNRAINTEAKAGRGDKKNKECYEVESWKRAFRDRISPQSVFKVIPALEDHSDLMFSFGESLCLRWKAPRRSPTEEIVDEFVSS